MYSTNIQPESEVRGSLPLINPKPEGRGVYQWQTSDDWGQESYICGIHCTSRGSYDIYYGDVTLGCRADYVTIKTTYNNVLYLFINSSTLFAPALADLKETLMSHVIDEFKFQQAIHKKWRVCTSTTMLLELLKYKAWYLWAICDNGGWTQFMERNCWPSITIVPERFSRCYMEHNM